MPLNNSNFPELLQALAHEKFAQSFADLSRLHMLLSGRHNTLTPLQIVTWGIFGRCSDWSFIWNLLIGVCSKAWELMAGHHDLLHGRLGGTRRGSNK